jgi:hypothetical protein
MAWSAFAAGFSKGFGTELSEGIKERRKEQNKYVDNMMDTAKAWQPKFLKANADVDADLELMKVMNTEFNISEAEFVALAQNYDMNDIYTKSVEAREAFKKVGLDPNAVNRDTLLTGLSLPKDFSLPEGMTATDAMRQIHLGYAKNLAADPNNKSDAHQQSSFAKAVAGVLMLDPRSSAEKIANQMQVMGTSVEDLNMFAAQGGVKGKPLDNVTRTGAFVLPNTDYTSGSFNTTLSDSRRSLYRTMLDLTDPTATVTDANSAAIRLAIGESNSKNINETNLATFIESGAGKFGQLEKQLINKGMSIGFNTRGMRDMALSAVRAEINTVNELDNFSEAVKSGKAVELILESVRETGEVTMETIEAILGSEVTERGGDVPNVTGEGVTAENNSLSDLENLQREMQPTGPQPTGPQPAEPAVVNGPPESRSASNIVNNIIGRNSGSLPESATAKITKDEPASPEVVLIAKKLAVPVEDDSPVVSTNTDTSPRVAPFMKRTMDPVADLLEKPTKALADSIEGPVRKLSSIIKQPAESANSILNNYMKPLKDAIAKGRNGDSKDVSLGDLFSDWFSTTFPGAKLPSNPLETVDFIAGTMSSDFEADPTGDTPPTVLDIVPKDQAFEILVYGALDTAMKQGVKFQDNDTAKQWLYDFLEKEEDFLIKTGLANEETGEYPNEKTIDLIANILKIGYGS